LPTSTSEMAPDVTERGRGFSAMLTACPSVFNVSASLCSKVANLLCLPVTQHELRLTTIYVCDIMQFYTNNMIQ